MMYAFFVLKSIHEVFAIDITGHFYGFLGPGARNRNQPSNRLAGEGPEG
jgi:hypothetical protein